MISKDDPTPIESLPRVDLSNRMSLLLIGDGFVSTCPLPTAGDLIIGRALEADISLDVASVSRRHALLHIGSTIRLEDLGSANGTFVNDQRLARGTAATLEPGATFELGSLLVVLQQGYQATRPRRIWTHAYFEARLEEECTRCDMTEGAFAVLRIRTANKQARGRALAELLFSALRPSDIVASYGPDDYEVLVVDASAGEAQRILERLEASFQNQGTRVKTGVASFPRDGRAAAALMAKACAEIDVPPGEDAAPPVVIEADVMKSLHKLIGRVAVSNINVLVLGQTGVGKEIVAERIHTLSPRVDKPLLRLNCAALSSNVLESELFGHERGAFTGAVAAKPGLLETASGGTVFLDEIGDMPLELQAKLLRVLETQQVRRVGGLKPKHIDIRIVAATHRNLEAEVAAGRFRQDLFFRLNGISVIVPPLRERPEEIEPLARAFVSACCKRQGKPTPDIAPRAIRALHRYTWPGNIRELRNIMERAVLLCTGDVIDLEHFPSDKLASTFEMQRVSRTPAPAVVPSYQSSRKTTVVDGVQEADSPVDLRAGVDDREREIIKQALAQADGNQTRAAKLLGISRRTLINRIEKYGLPRPRKRG